MGVWGANILENDYSADLQNRYKHLLGEKHTDEQVNAIIINENVGEADADDEIVFWLSFALIQWNFGRLQHDVKQKALEIIDNGADLHLWDEEPVFKQQREMFLQALKEQLNTPQPKVKKVAKRFVPDTTLKAGDAISYQLLSGEYMIFKVIGIIEQVNGSRYPLFEICDWTGIDIPSKEEINKLSIKRKKPIIHINIDPNSTELYPVKKAISQSGKRDDPSKRIRLIAENVDIVSDMQTPYSIESWKYLDEALQYI